MELPEPIPELHFRRGARIQIAVCAVFAAINCLLLPFAATQPDMDAAAVRQFLYVDLPTLGVNVAANVWLLAFARSEAQRRAATIVGAIALMVSIAAGYWLVGSVSNVFAFLTAICVIAVWRVYFDARIGAIVLAAAVGFHAGLVGLELAGVVRQHPLYPGALPDYATPGRVLVLLGYHLLVYVSAWVGATYVARRFARSEQALRAAEQGRERLRQQLADREVASATTMAEDSSVGRLSGRVLGEVYQLGELLGRGGMGDVYEGINLTDGTSVAIKVLHPEIGTPANLERFRREASLAAKLAPHQVARVLEMATDADGCQFLVMERLRGEDLSALLRRRGSLPPDELLPMLDELAATLDAAHALGIVHRDLKPQNVFLVSNGAPGAQLRLLDFGAARLAEASASGGLTGSAVVIGTPGYLSPEQARGGSAAVTPRTDLFALGAVIYRALTGRKAFPAIKLEAALLEVLTHDPAPPSSLVPGISTDIDHVMVIALAKHPEQRYACASELVADLRLALAGALPEETRARSSRIQAGVEPDGPTRTLSTTPTAV